MISSPVAVPPPLSESPTMPGLVDAKGPSYISSHSADVILSDIRPTKLRPDALRAINILLDEFLYKMLSVSGSLATDKLRASLLGLLPTNLGKEALLEAEVELRAYWERTEPRIPAEDDSRSFHLLWAFELLRLKCEAYSTLNEEDEDPNLEGRVNEKLGKPHPHPPKVGLVDPAALYLTAILEAICEHVLSSVGRVVARDSSRAIATVNDLFVALCEDVSIYGLFKTMKVYQQIEDMSKGTLPRRSKSFTRNDSSRTSSPIGHTNVISSSGSRSRQSLVNNNSKVSSERDGDSQLSHNKSESWRSEQLFGEDEVPHIAEDAAMLREFDDLMRSTSTMKVSLTPDRLRTMEVYKQQRDINLNRRPPKFSFPKQNPSQKHLVDSILEDEEENPPQTRVRQDSGISRRTTSLAAIIPGRIRSISTSSTGIRGPTKNLMRSPSVQPAPSSLSRMIPGTPEMLKIRDIRKPPDIGIPARTHTRQHRRDSVDLDDVMNGSEEDGSQGSSSTKQKIPLSATQRINRPQYPVSSHTRDLMAFLAEGPPEPRPKLSQSGSELFEFLAQGPPDYPNSPSTVDSKMKAPGRLQRMISKLSMGGEKNKWGSDTSSFKQPNSPARSIISTKPSVTTLSSLANRPIPPRPNPPQYSYSYDEDKYTYPSSSLRRFHPDIPSPHETPSKPVPITPTVVPSDTQENRPLTTHINGYGNAKNGLSIREVRSEPQQTPPLSPVRSISHKVVPVNDPPPIPFFTETDAKDMQRLLTHATTADECRLIFNMFMARSGMTEASVSEKTDTPYPSSSSIKNASAPLVQSSVGEALIESTLIEFFLSGTALPDTISGVLSEPDVANNEALPVATETRANAKPFDSLSPSNRQSVFIPQQPPS